MENTALAAKYIKSDYFRPPHGWMKHSQYQQINNTYQIVMWDIISGDYRSNITPQAVSRNVLNTVRRGSIIVFHDSYKAQKNLTKALPMVIRELKKRGYIFGEIPLAEQKKKVAI